MREILFRAKDATTKEWFYGYPVIAPDDADTLCYFYSYGEHGEFYQHVADVIGNIHDNPKLLNQKVGDEG